MTFQNSFTRKLGLEWTDPIVSSRIGFPNASCIDLVGCGSPTHVKVSHSAGFNFRNACGPLYEGLGSSVSFIISNNNLNDPIAADIITDLRTWLATTYSVASSVITDNASAPTATSLTLGNTLALQGSGFLFDGIKTGGSRIFVSYPVIIENIDQCGIVRGYTLSSTYDRLDVDPLTCIPYAAVTASIKMRVSNDPIAYTASTNFGAAASDLNAVVALESAWSAPVGSGACGQSLFSAVRTAYNSAFGNNTYSLGV